MKCRTCKEEKPEDQFRLTEKNMVNFRCKPCWIIYDKRKAEERSVRKRSTPILKDASYFCKYCQQEKPSSDFREGEIRWRGKGNRRCKDCLSSYESRTRSAANERDPEMYAHRKLVRKQYHEKNREAHIVRMKLHYRTNIKMYDYWRSKALAKSRGATQFLTLEQWEILRSYKNCYWCGILLTPAITNIDHVVPICEGGQHTFENLAKSCANCNLGREWERKVLEWRLPEVPESESNRKEQDV